MEAIIPSILRTAVSFLILLFILAMFGRQINAHKNHFNMAMAITAGSLVANMGFNVNLKFLPMLCSFMTLVLFYYLAAIGTYRSPFFYKILSGPSTILIENGKINEKNLASVKIPKEGLHQQLRENGIFSISEVKKAILEPNGLLSIENKAPLEKGSFACVIPEYLLKGVQLPAELIRDGECLYRMYPEQFISWFEGYLYGKGMDSKTVGYAVISSDSVLFAINSESLSLPVLDSR
ncbi:hypothetical protein DRW41_13325 [Neobacillus piezotolerans]|uniref:YetF C-terminal domain-containing protein n=1 Tax=Neobacillus piezotolerans TaxID=2259171 RepID=A0A3D8GPT5_9BACI|nr:YetF domain-containing protein [Neobacillus piezotolerans]RDU36505.1 hypothetical protein DRW41_13325 [Neobacillus piezotolerans]